MLCIRDRYNMNMIGLGEKKMIWYSKKIFNNVGRFYMKKIGTVSESKSDMKSLDYEFNESNVVGTQNILSQMGNFLKEQMNKTLVVYKFFNYKSNKNDKNKNNN